MEVTAVAFKDVTISYGEKGILSDLTFSWNRGDFIYIIGEVGVGKTTLLRAIYHDLSTVSGSREVLGRLLQEMREKDIPSLRKRLGLVFQNYHLLADKTVYANLYLFLKVVVGWSDNNRIDLRIQEILKEVEMEEYAASYICELSEGQKLRVAVARAIIHTPPILVLDEPTGNLDVESIKKVMNLLYRYAEKNKVLVILATHNLQLVRAYLGQVYLLSKGKMSDVTERFYKK